MKLLKSLLFAIGLSALAGTAVADTTLTIATVNNNDMIVMQRLSKEYEKANPGTKLNWVVLEENVLRQRLTTDIAANSGQFDVMTIGMYEAPMWGKNGWLTPFTDTPADYDIEDVLKTVRDGLSSDGKLYALPFYGESQMTMYRKDLFDKAGLKMPDKPTWADLAEFAKKLNDPNNGVYGICLRGKPGWGEIMGQITPVVNSFGGRWFDEKWKPQLTTPQWKEAVTFYVDLLKNYGPPGVTSNGYNETLALFATGKCAMWNDATVAAGFLADPKNSVVADKIAYASPAYAKHEKGSHYLWAWALAVPASSKQQDEAKKFIYWATSKDYLKMVGETEGWVAVPPGTRKSLYDNPEYLKAAPFAKITFEAMASTTPSSPTVEPVPYYGIGFVGIPEYQAIGTEVSQEIAAAISGQKSVDEALAAGQAATERAMEQAGYGK